MEERWWMVEEAALSASLEERWKLRRQELPPCRRRWFDTLDWRLHGQGWELWWEASEKGAGAFLLAREGSLPEVWQASGITELPEGPLRQAPPAVASLARPRCLLPLITVDLQRERIHLLDERSKTVLRLTREQGAVEESGVTLPALLRLEPLKGYETVAEAVKEMLTAPTAAPSLLTAALATVDRAPGDYTSKLVVELDGDMPSAEALRKILGVLLHTVQRNEEGTRRDLDPEFLHDFRVAVRRARSMLSQLRGVLPAAEVQAFAAELKWLGNITGTTRDLDVYLLKMSGYRAALPPAVQPHLDPLERFLRRRQRREQRRLARALGSARYRRLLTSWQTVVDGGDEGEERPIVEVAAERIAKAWEKLLTKGGQIHPESPAAKLHKLRIDGKKLRYLLEAFGGLFEGETLSPVVPLLKKLQDTLGDFHDYEVQQEAMGRFAHQLMEEELAESGTPAVETLLALGRLQGELAAGQGRERRRFHQRFARFAELGPPGERLRRPSPERGVE